MLPLLEIHSHLCENRVKSFEIQQLWEEEATKRKKYHHFIIHNSNKITGFDDIFYFLLPLKVTLCYNFPALLKEARLII